MDKCKYNAYLCWWWWTEYYSVEYIKATNIIFIEFLLHFFDDFVRENWVSN